MYERPQAALAPEIDGTVNFDSKDGLAFLIQGTGDPVLQTARIIRKVILQAQQLGNRYFTMVCPGITGKIKRIYNGQHRHEDWNAKRRGVRRTDHLTPRRPGAPWISA